MGTKRKRSEDDGYFGLSPFQLQQLRYHVHELGIKATDAFKKMNETIARLYGVRYNQITVLIKRIAKERYNIDDAYNPNQLLLTPPVRIETTQLEPPTTSQTLPTTNTPSSGQPHSGPDEVVASSNAIQAPGVNKLEREVVVIPKVVAVREVETPRVYYQYLNYAGKMLSKINAEGLKQAGEGDSSYVPLHFTKWTAAYQLEHGKTLYQTIMEQKTPEHVALVKQWEQQVEELKQQGPRHEELSENKFVREQNKLIESVKERLRKLAEKYETQTQGYMFDLQSGKSMNISAGKVGRRVSRELEKKLTTHPATMFAAELYLKNKKSNTPMPNRLEISGQLDNTSLRARARSEMLVRINEELIRLNKKTTKVVQIVKMLRPEGYQGVRLEGFGFTAKQYTSLSSNQCIRLLNNLKIPGKVRLVLVKPSSDKDEEETADEDGDINEEDENEDNDTEDGGNEDSDGILNGDDDDGDNGDNGDDGDEECGNNRDNNANDNDGDTSQSVNQINSAIETY